MCWDYLPIPKLPLKIGNGQVISSHILFSTDYLSMLIIYPAWLTDSPACLDVYIHGYEWFVRKMAVQEYRGYTSTEAKFKT